MSKLEDEAHTARSAWLIHGESTCCLDAAEQGCLRRPPPHPHLFHVARKVDQGGVQKLCGEMQMGALPLKVTVKA
jgi:hypothetical protein